jgi:hypothetical protein
MAAGGWAVEGSEFESRKGQDRLGRLWVHSTSSPMGTEGIFLWRYNGRGVKLVTHHCQLVPYRDNFTSFILRCTNLLLNAEEMHKNFRLIASGKPDKIANVHLLYSVPSER